MSAVRSSGIRPQPRRRRPVWGIVAAVVAGMAILFGVGFGVSWFVKSRTTPAPVAVPSASATAGACVQATVIPAQELPAAGEVVVNVYNGTKKQGLAAKTADVLRTVGFTVKKVANAPDGTPVTGVAELRYGPKGESGARLLAYYLPGARLVPIDRTGKRVDVVLGKQFDNVADEAEVAAALASPSPVASGPGCVAPTPSSS